MKVLDVNIPDKAYKIYISHNDWAAASKTLKALIKENRIFIITNPQIKKLYAHKISTLLAKHFELIWICMPEGEQHKNLTTCQKIFLTLSKNNATRQSTLLALGGGVVGDVTGFVAATYMRGIDFIQFPTSLLAQIDASIGGKTAVDLPTGKNLVGAFYQPKAVFIFTDFLNTLPDKEFKSGLAEVIKYALIKDPLLFAYLTKQYKIVLSKNKTALIKIILTCCKIKARIVAEDEKELGLRAILNFGHTLGHAIEVLNGFKTIKHGEAVAMGMLYAAKLSALLKITTPDTEAKIKHILKLYNLPQKWPTGKTTAYKQALKKDKKASIKNIRFILIEKIGKVQITPLTVDTILQCLNN